MTHALLERGISLNEIETSNVEFYLEYLGYRQEKDSIKAEKEMDSLGL